ncbi:DUF4418 family protein [Clostridium cylindrosporum]|uniref:DUF4418 family protein n=1 Tax=Clostridium cylindrosporum DSM 605 TaxID=1121307 RepID=A0A0J8G4B6_CLOCY|nr:DUF4418 family protein [Clostridium cylindrosporum]KMT22511.1 hypothetical protein CLCY_10c00560 [Clostridium cylindrosporum DSM 605]
MKNLSTKIIPAVLVVISLLILGAIFIWSPVCTGTLELANGNMTHMKCFYTAKAEACLAIILLVSSIASFFTKGNQLAIITIGILFIVLTFDSPMGIGICKKEIMACHDTAAWIRTGGAITILGGILMLFKKRD